MRHSVGILQQSLLVTPTHTICQITLCAEYVRNCGLITSLLVSWMLWRDALLPEVTTEHLRLECHFYHEGDSLRNNYSASPWKLALCQFNNNTSSRKAAGPNSCFKKIGQKFQSRRVSVLLDPTFSTVHCCFTILNNLTRVNWNTRLVIASNKIRRDTVLKSITQSITQRFQEDGNWLIFIFFTHGVLARFEFLIPTFPQLFAISIMIIEIIYINWIRRLLRFGSCFDGVCTVEGGVRKAWFKGGGGVKLSLSGFWEIAACVNSGVTLKGEGSGERCPCWQRI